jgi:pseudouridine synthase
LRAEYQAGGRPGGRGDREQPITTAIRLNKLLAERGVAARRKCDALIFEGLVRVDGEVVRGPGRRVDPEEQTVTVRGRKISAPARLVYYALHKPTGVLSTMRDPAGRPTVKRLLPDGAPRLFPVGRLDGDTSGLLLFTNDGALAHRLMHPRYEVPKTYQLTLATSPSESALRKLLLGFEFEAGERSRPAEVEVRSRMGEVTVVTLTLCEGRNRQVRRMCDALGLELLALARVRVGPVELGDLPVGRVRKLDQKEVAALRRMVQESQESKKRQAGQGKEGT